MSKGLEELEKIKGLWIEVLNDEDKLIKEMVGDLPSTKIIEKELKALEIIKEKKVNVELLHICRNFEEYNMEILPLGNISLTQEEYNLLKEVLL